jgi:hypothetical protein
MDIEKETNESGEIKKRGAPLGNQNAKKKPFTEQMRRYILANPKKMERIIEGVFKEAEEGNLAALHAIMDRVEGKPTQSTEISGPEGTELVKGIGFVFVDSNAKSD